MYENKIKKKNKKEKHETFISFSYPFAYEVIEKYGKRKIKKIEKKNIYI